MRGVASGSTTRPTPRTADRTSGSCAGTREPHGLRLVQAQVPLRAGRGSPEVRVAAPVVEGTGPVAQQDEGLGNAARGHGTGSRQLLGEPGERLARSEDLIPGRGDPCAARGDPGARACALAGVAYQPKVRLRNRAPAPQ